MTNSSGSFIILLALAIRVAIKQRHMLGHILSSGNRRLTAKRFRNLIIFSFVQNIHQLALSLFVLVPATQLTLSDDVPFWPGWQVVHENITFVVHVSAHDATVEIAEQSSWMLQNWQEHADTAVQLYMSQWSYAFHAFIYFGLLGFTYEAKEFYYRLLGYFVTTPPAHMSSKESGEVDESSDVNTKPIRVALSSPLPPSRTASNTLSSMASMLFLSYGSTRQQAATSADISSIELEQAISCDEDVASLDSPRDAKASGADDLLTADDSSVVLPPSRQGKADKVLGRVTLRFL